MSNRVKEIRLKVREAVHAAVKVLAEHEQVTIDRWVESLVEREVRSHLAIARRLAETVKTSDLISETRGPTQDSIYFIQRGDGGPIKIGRSTYIKRRLASLQSGCAEKLTVLAQFRSQDGSEERILHKRFRHLRQEGEWFSPAPELLTFIKSIPVIVGTQAENCGAQPNLA